MKTLLSLTLGIMVSTASVEAQNVTGQTAQSALPAPTPYAVTTQAANSRVWQSTDYTISPSGEVVANTHRYTELASGLNHLVNGQWVASSEQIEILPNGTAVATNGQHQASFPGDIYQGQIQLLTPDGQLLQSRPMGLSYFDGINTVMIAVLTNSIGLVSGNNQVIYPNAFTGFKVDLRYTYTKAGFEQDVILRQQPPTPDSLGLNPDTARLQIMTEFFSPPQPAITSTTLPAQAGISLTDQILDFGTMQMVPGRAFLLGQNAQDAGAMVSKHWVQVYGRQFLIEEVPVDAILEGLAALPLTAMNSNSGKHSHTASKHLKLPPQRLAQSTSKTMLIAKADSPAKGFVLDYQTVTGTVTNYTFQGDTTYYISGSLTLRGTNSFEGGAVLKYTNGASLNFVSIGTNAVQMLSTAYRPVIFTALDDNSVGDTISGSTGTPTNYYANPALYFSSSPAQALSNFRIACAYQAISTLYTPLTVYNAQIINCQNAAAMNLTSINFRNVLFANDITCLNAIWFGTIDIQNSTFNQIQYLIAQPQNNVLTLNLTNNVLANITNLSAGSYTFTTNASYNGFYSSPSFGTVTKGSSVYPFQAVGAGSFYLANGSSFQNVGSTNIDSTLLVCLKQKTTYPPILYSNVTVSINTTLNPQAQRDTDTPDLGFHYDPLDYLVDQFGITNATLSLTNGVAIAGYNDSDLVIEDGSSIVSFGSPLYPNWLVRYSSVQEQPVLMGLSLPAAALTVNPDHVSVAPVGQFRFTKFACPAGCGDHLYHYQNNWSYGTLLVQDCEFWGGANLFGGNTNTVAILKNNLFARSTFSATPLNSTSISYLYVTNNLFWGVSSVVFGQRLSAAASTNYCVFNNDFDSCGNIGNTTVSITNGYNAYINSTGYVYPTNATDIFTNVGLVYQTGPLGTFYQLANSPLINKGSTNANSLGFYQYTVITNLVSGLEIKETNSIVDIGYHYVAVDTNGIPIDTNVDGVPDYLEDINGNGQVDSGEIGWNIVGDLGLQVIITRPRNGSTLP